MKEQVTEAEKRELDRAREDWRDKQPYATEVDDREGERAKTVAPREDQTESQVK